MHKKENKSSPRKIRVSALQKHTMKRSFKLLSDYSRLIKRSQKGLESVFRSPKNTFPNSSVNYQQMQQSIVNEPFLLDDEKKRMNISSTEGSSKEP